MKCCGTRACRACAIIKINKTRRCWNNECGKESVSTANDLKNDDVLRKAVEYFKKNGKMTKAHKKILKKTTDGKKALEDVSNKFNRPCKFGDKCKRKACLFTHEKTTRSAEARMDEEVPAPPGLEVGELCFFEALCPKKDVCKFKHPNSEDPCKFDNSPSSKAPASATSAGEEGRKSNRDEFRSLALNGNPVNGGMGGRMGVTGSSMCGMGADMCGMGGRVGEMDGGMTRIKMRRSDMARDDEIEDRNTNLIEMQKELGRMMANAAQYGILPSYDGILGVVNGINTVISNN